MDDIQKLTLNDFLDAVAGTIEFFSKDNDSIKVPGTSKFSSMETYIYLEKETNYFDSVKVNETLKSIDNYLHKLDSSYTIYNSLLMMDHIDVFKLDQFVELISTLEIELKNNQSFEQFNTINPIERKEQIELGKLRYYDSNLDYNDFDSIYYQEKFKEIKEVSLRGNNVSIFESTFIDMEIEYFKLLFNKLKLMRRFKDLTLVQNFIDHLDKKNRVLSSLQKCDKNQFKTNLSDTQRKELCCKIITDCGGRWDGKSDNRLFIDITENHRATLMYLLGGEYPNKIEPMKVAVIKNLSDLLKKITDVDGFGKDKGTKVVPEFMKRFCMEYLTKKDGGKIEAVR